MDHAVMIPLMLGVIAIALAVGYEPDGLRQRDKWECERKYRKLIDTESNAEFRDHCHMSKWTFLDLLEILVNEGGLEDSKYACAGSKLVLIICVLRGMTYRQIGNSWSVPIGALTKYVREVSTAIIACRERFMREKHANDVVQAEIHNNPKLAPYFTNCIGAFDGTFVPATIPDANDTERYRDRKDNISQNVFVCCDFDGVITSICVGWEGRANDSQVLADLVHRGELPVFDHKYYLADGGYPLTPYCLTPYRKTRYHLKEWAQAGQRPANARELFNLRHSQARNVIERLFGIAKKRFPILVNMNAGFSIEAQAELVLCAFLLHSYLMLERDYFPNNGAPLPEPDNNEVDPILDDAGMHTWRDDIAASMWQDYQHWVLNHPDDFNLADNIIADLAEV
jgi:hypothetical protein